MKIIKLFVVTLFAFASMILSVDVFAEDINKKIPEEEKSILVATVNIQNIKVISQDNNIFKISFNITNREGIQSDVKYGIKLIGKDEGGQYVADEKVYQETLTLNENSSLIREISYEAPTNLTGEYSMYVVSKNSSGFPFATAYLGEVSLDSSTRGIKIFSETCTISVLNEINKNKYTLSQGIDISKDETIVLNCDVLNTSEQEINATPNYETTYRTIYGDIVSHEGGSNDKIVFKPLEKKNISLNLPKTTKPQAYDIKVSLSEKENSSNTVVVHYVLRGNSGTINNISLNNDYYKKGEHAILSFIWSGSADIFPDNRSGVKEYIPNFIDVEISNGNGKLCSNPILNQGIGSDLNSKQELSIPIISNCKDPVVKLILKDNNGNILDQKDFLIDSKKSNDMLYFYVGILVMVFLTIFSFIYFKKKKINKLPIQIIFIFFAISLFGTILPGVASADTFSLGVSNGVNALFSINGISSSYNPGQAVIFSGDVTISSCNNISFDTSVSVTFNGVNKNLLSKNVTGGGTLSMTPASFVAPSQYGNYSMTIDLSFGEYSTSKTINFRVGTTPNGYQGACAYSNSIYAYTNDPYHCSYGSSINRQELSNSWTWECQGDPGYGDSGICTLNKTPVAGGCGYWAVDTCYSGHTYEDLPDSDTESIWKCKGLYGGVDTECKLPLPASCGENMTCVNSVVNFGPYVYSNSSGGYTTEWLCSNATGGRWCSEELTSFYAEIDGSCPIDLDSSNCSLNAYWKVINNNGKNFKICSTSLGSTNCESIGISGSNGEGSLYIGDRKFGVNTTLSIQNTSGEVYDEATIIPYCSSGSWNGSRCINNGGWSSWSPWSECTASCNGNVGTVQGTKTSTRTCTSPAPSLYGNDCSKLDGGNNIKTEVCSVECLAKNPTSPIITGPAEFGTGTLQNFNFLSYDPEGDLIRYGINWNYIDSNNYYSWNNYLYNTLDRSYKGSETINEWFPAPSGSSFQFVKSGISGDVSRKWEYPGTYVFRAIAQDYHYNVSKLWSLKEVKVYADAWVDFNTNKVRIIKGETVELKWNSKYTNSCSFTNFESTGECYGGNGWGYCTTTKGVAYERPILTTEYLVTCSPSYESRNKEPITKSVTVEVIDPSDETPISITFKPESKKIDEGDEVILEWSTSPNALYCDGIGFNTIKKVSGTHSVHPTSDITYKLKCYYSNGENLLAESKITVTPAPLDCNNNPNHPLCISCNNKSLDTGEDGVDCGGVCLPVRSCTKKPPVFIER